MRPFYKPGGYVPERTDWPDGVGRKRTYWRDRSRVAEAKLRALEAYVEELEAYIVRPSA